MLLKIAMVFAAFSGASGVALGAFGAHGLKGSIEPRLLETFQTGVHYQLIHALAGMNVVGCDLVEVSPPYDPSGNTALTAANLLFEMLCILPGVTSR